MTSDDQSADRGDEPRYRPGPHLVALFAAVFTWPLIFVGGLVTTYRVGMAVPDWPTTFGINMFLYRFWDAAWGVFIEHGHRLYGAAVGMATIVLAAWFLAFERRGWMKALGVTALLAVTGQGVLGGYRVRLNSTDLAFVHACSAQACFALMVALCVLTGRVWSNVEMPISDPAHLRRRSLVTLVLVFLQILAGARLRHFPSPSSLLVHVVLSTIVMCYSGAHAWRVERMKNLVPNLSASARALALLLAAQVVLGVAAWWLLRPFDSSTTFVTNAQAFIRTGHQANAALLLASSVVLTLRSFRILTPSVPAAELRRASVDLEVMF
jgi:cytochrome c oxidase assembly protein subunit 15